MRSYRRCARACRAARLAKNHGGSVSVGIRPCTGAILVLIFALTQGMFWAGVAATFAMASVPPLPSRCLPPWRSARANWRLSSAADQRLCQCRVDDLRHRRLSAHPPVRRDPVRSFARTGAAVLNAANQALRGPAIGVAGSDRALVMARQAPDLVLIAPLSQGRRIVFLFAAPDCIGEQGILILRGIPQGTGAAPALPLINQRRQ